MAKLILKSKYEAKQLVSEDILSYTFLGTTHYSTIPIQIHQYKEEFLTAPIVKELIEACEQLIHFRDPHVLNMIDYYYDGKAFFTIHEISKQYMTLEAYLNKHPNWNAKTAWKISTGVLGVLIKLETTSHLYGHINLASILVSEDLDVKCTKIALPLILMKHYFTRFDVLEDCIFYPPEFLQHQDYTAQSDIYSFGILLYFLLSKKWPYSYTIKCEKMKKELLAAPIPFSPAYPKLPDRLSGIISACLNQNPRHRFQSFSDLITAYKKNKELPSQPDLTTPSIHTEMADSLKQVQKKRLKGYIQWAAIGLGILSVLAGLYFLYIRYLTAIPEKTIPSVIGKSQYEAEALLSAHGLKSIVAGARAHAFLEQGTIIESKPPAGRLVKQNRLIRLFVSKGKGPILVPDLVGLGQNGVELELEKSGLAVEVIKEVFSIQYKKGVVIKQFPTPSTFSDPNDPIEIVLSKGYPIEYKIEKAASRFFKKKDHLRVVNMTFFILDEGASQEVKLVFKHNDRVETLYLESHPPGDVITLNFELDLEGVLELYLNNEKISTKRIIDN